jgi:hypothetical protein
MNYQLGRTMQETHTTLTPAEVLVAAKRFFARRQGIYAAFVEKEGPTFVNLRGQGGEELIIGVQPAPDGTRVTGSTYLFDQQVARFFSTLPPYAAEDRADGPLEATGTGDAAATPPAGGSAA